VVVHEKNKVYINISHQSPTTAYLSIENKRHYIFLIPYDTLKITLNEKQRPVDFDGMAGQINKYRRDKEEKFGDIIWAKYSIAYNTPDLGIMKRKMDAFNQAEIDLLDEARIKYKLPDWFYNLEKNDIGYLSAIYKISVPAKRRYLEELVIIPENYYSFIEELPVNNEEAILSDRYYSYLDGLTSHFYFTDSLRQMSIKERVKILQPLRFKFYDENLAPNLRDVAYARETSRIVQAPTPYDSTYVYAKANQIDNVLIKGITEKFLNKTEDNTLKEGEKAPNFYLADVVDSLRTLKEYKGNVILLSFWGTWCKPCIEEFPYENKLAKTFADENFKLITICLDSERDRWQAYITKYNLAGPNLYANKQWSENLRQSYNFRGAPYYVLLNKDLTVIQNKFLRPSHPDIEQEIRKWLE
jgi:thiol-disulfide isomerase/thioredoxin